MPAHISPLDPRFISLGGAAALAAGTRRGLHPDAVKDSLTRAIFAGAFEPPAVDLFDETALRKRDAPEHWLQIQIDALPGTLTPEQAALRPRPQDYFAAGRETIASVMQSLGALPGDGEQWMRLLGDPERPDGKTAAFAALTRTPWRHYPESGRDYLEAILIPKGKLDRWFALRNLDMAVTCGTSGAGARFGTNSAEIPSSPEKSSRERGQGRPLKAAWARIREAVFKIFRENPHIQMKGLAFEARALVAKEFPEEEVPSVATIQRKLCDILRDGSVH